MSFTEMLLEGQRQLLGETAVRRQQDLERIPLDARLWMAASPGWTASLAKEAGFPAGPGGVERTLDEMVDQGICTTIPVLGSPVRDPASGRVRPGVSERRYVMDAETSRRLIGEVKQDPQLGVNAVKGAVVAAGDAALTAGTSNAMRKWAMLASQAEQPSALRAQFDAAVNEALKLGRIDDAVAWIEAALPLERVLSDEIGSLVRLAGLRVQLRQRRADNERYLERFLERPEQVQAFDDLLSGPDTLWSLHYAGIAGVGKTMLMRHLQAHVAPLRKASTARIDFDHLNPQYPSTKPALLLLELAEELRLHDEIGTASAYFESFVQKAVTFHEGLTSADRPERSALELVRDAEFQLLLKTFASGAAYLPQPVTLMLDTCEELSKMLPDGSTPGAVAATFEILEALHGELPKMRVIFGGRRPLASVGAGGWRAREDQGPRRQPRPYLRLHEIRGFVEADAKRYLVEKAECRDDLISVILTQCAEKGYTSQFTWTVGGKVSTEPRYNPFELALYGSWVREDPSLTANTIASTDVDQYVRVRIVGRIANATLAKLLPAIAWLGRFDFGSVVELSGLAPESAEVRKLFDELANQEWIDRQPKQFLEVERRLRPRLLSYFRANDTTSTELARQVCLAHLERVTLDRPFDELDVSAFEAMLRVVKTDPVRGARWWEAVEERVRVAGVYTWIRVVTTRLLADDNWAETARQHIRAAILATHAAALIHNRDYRELDDSWAAVWSDAEYYPTKSGKRRLRRRASIGRGAIPKISVRNTSEQLAATLVGHLDRQSDTLEEKGYPPELIVWLIALVRQEGFTAELRAFAAVLAGRALVLAPRPAEAAVMFKKALEMRLALGRTNQRWLDWVTSEDLSSRIAFECLFWGYPAALSPKECLEWFDGPTELGGLDAERLAAALLTVEGATRPPEKEVAADTIAQSRRLGLSTGSAEGTLAHRRQAPLYAVAAQEMALRREIPDALDLLQAQSGQAESFSIAYDDVLAADRALMKIFRRFRLMDEGYRAKDSLLSSEAPDDRLLCAALDALGRGADVQAFSRTLPRGKELLGEPSALKHVRWSTLTIQRRDLGEAGVAWAKRSFNNIAATPESGFFDVSCALDAIEVRYVARKLGLDEGRTLTIAVPDLSSWQRRHPTQAVEALTLHLRAAGLALPEFRIPPETLSDLVDRVGLRRAATIALEEGELLALRLTQQSLPLLQLARRMFEACGDHLQAWIACACEALALARLRSPEDLTDSLEKATVTCSKRLWSQVVNLVEDGKPITDHWLRPWLLRVAACVAFERDRGGHGNSVARVIKAWDQLASLPAEVADWLGTSESGRDTAFSPIARNAAARSPDIIMFSSTRSRRGGSIFEPTEIEVTLANRDKAARLSLMTPPSDMPYHNIRAEMAPRLTKLIGNERRSLNARLLVDPYSAWLPWEAVLSPRELPGRPYTRITGGRTSVFSGDRFSAERRTTAYTLTIDHAGADLGGSVWKIAPWTYVQSPRELVVKQDPGDAQILHIVADPIETHAGVRLRLSDKGFDSDTKERGLLVRSEEVRRFLPNIELCVLQLPLARGRRTGVDRENAGLLRSFAAELHRQGLPAVVTVPALSFEDAAAVLREFAQRYSSLDGLTEAAGRASRALVERAWTEDALESAFDICVYID